MKVGIMQPYFFPYIAYYQLIEEVDTYVIADDLNFIKNGYINKNSILLDGKPFKISLQLRGASQNKHINQIEVGENGSSLLSTIRNAYKKAPFFADVYPLLEKILLNNDKNLGTFLGFSIKEIVDYLDIQTEIVYSSEIDKDNSLKFDARIIDICHQLGADHYINAIGGQKLYDKKRFLQNGVKLSFLETEYLEYSQYNNEFLPNLSMIDVMMFNSKEEINGMLKKYHIL
ncbi:MAG TPA: hypothetical protein ENK75_00020 [Saprospiraceae bacterium]|nr:hypothetical protein [Saprospiraceae bacterium]